MTKAANKELGGMMMKKLLMASAVLEISIGILLLVTPNLLILLLFGGVADTPIGLAVARLAGAALLSLGAVCWFGRRDAHSRAADGIAAGMLIYNLAAVAMFLWLRYIAGLTGMGLLPASAVHAAMAAWCISCLRAAGF